MERDYNEIRGYLSVQGMLDPDTNRLTAEGAQVLFVLLSVAAIEETFRLREAQRLMSATLPEGMGLVLTSDALEVLMGDGSTDAGSPPTP